MIENLFFELTKLSPQLKKNLWQWWYELLAQNYQKSDWEFMNYGFADLQGELSPLNLSQEDESNRYFIQLYQYVSSALPLAQKTVLEVGSGRGGGAHFLAKMYHPQKIIGVDLSAQNINLANQLYQRPNLAYVQGDSEKLPFENDYFDLVINVESSHCYPAMAKFMEEVKRVLKIGGLFSWADLRPLSEVESLEKCFNNCGLKKIKFNHITANVVRALELVNDGKEEAIKNNVPWFLRQAFREFAGVKNGKIYDGFVQGEMVYLSAVFIKEKN